MPCLAHCNYTALSGASAAYADEFYHVLLVWFQVACDLHGTIARLRNMYVITATS